jgi:enoyl-CoA hydratase/carnithine racemase
MADMMLTSRVMSAAEAERVNAVQYVVPAGESLAKATELAHRITENPPLVNWAVAAYLQRTGDMSHDDGMFAESLLGPSIRVGQNTDRIEAFLEGRAKPIERPSAAGGD